MNVIIVCEESGVVRDKFIELGHNAWSCDLKPGRGKYPSRHIQGDARDVLGADPGGWDLMIAHPDCTYLTNSAEWAYSDKPMIKGKPRKLKPGTLVGEARRQARREAAAFVVWLAGLPILQIAIENPVGALSRLWRAPDQYIQPHEYGDDASKKTCLWLKNLPLLEPTKHIDPRYICCGSFDVTADYHGCPNCCGDSIPLPRWANQTDSGQNRHPPSADRAQNRSETFPGWADAMGEQWGDR